MRDIYGDKSEMAELAGDVLASSFAKASTAENHSPNDVLRSLLQMVSMNLASQAMTAARLHGTPKIYFIGSFCRDNLLGQLCIQETVKMTQ